MKIVLNILRITWTWVTLHGPTFMLPLEDTVTYVIVGLLIHDHSYDAAAWVLDIHILVKIAKEFLSRH